MEILVYVHVHGLPGYLDKIDDELSEIASEQYAAGYTLGRIEADLNEFNKVCPTDRHGRTVNRYIYRRG